MIIPSIYVKFSYINSSIAVNGEGVNDEEDSKENDEGSEFILKFILLYMGEYAER